jgi:mono/diheme cytochrome c family protein
MAQDERHYNPKTIHKIFFFVTLGLLFALVAMFAKDYSRQWKKYQETFRTIQVEKAYVKLDAASKKLEADPKYKETLAALETEQKNYKQKCSTLGNVENEIKSLKSENDLIQQKYKFARAEVDAAKYRFEESAAHHENEAATEKEFTALKKKVNDLKLKLESSDTRLAAKQKLITDCSAQLKNVEREKSKLTKQIEILEKKLKSTDVGQMSVTNHIASLVRNLPVIDLANPNNKIEQVVLNDIHDNVNFMTVPKVERCTTCHLGITNPDYANEAQPYKTHPNLTQYVGNDSVHPIEEFGCTVCHGGRGRGTDFIGAAHVPKSEEQRKEWERKYGWHPTELWEEPMLPLPYVEAGCFKCHNNQTTIKGADKLNLGLQVIERAGCYNCHAIDTFKEWPKTGPDLTKISSKLSPDWAYKWIEMPQSFHKDTWMPAFFHQSNNNDPESVKRSQQEIHAIVHYLYHQSEKFDLAPIPVQGDAVKGEEIVASVGCFACHNINDQKDEKTTADSLRREFGPSLSNLGSKTDKEWLFNWLKDPYRYHPGSRMPNLRLSDQEAADAATYLVQGKNAQFDQAKPPAIDDKILNAIVLTYLTKNETVESADKKVQTMSQDDKLLYSGEKLIGQYGCFACHNIKGFENAKQIGADLNQEGNKSTHKLDFGFVQIEHTNYNWIRQKVHDPRIYDTGKIKAPDEKLIMPNFYLNDEELDAVTTVVLGLVDDKNVKNKKYPQTTENLYIEKGNEIIAKSNCQACHIIEGQGGSIRNSVVDYLVKYEGKDPNDAKAVVTSFSPPNLVGEGQKVQADWLFDFIHSPTTIRPWLKVRMPSYKLNAAHLNSLVKYFNTLDHEEFPFMDKVDTSMNNDELAQVEKLFSKEYFDCASCHIVGKQMPGGTPDRWAPDFGLAKDRLKPDWIIKWLTNPAALLPGTKMPTYFDPKAFDESGPPDIFDGDEHKQIKMLRNYLMTISEHPPTKPAPAAASTSETPAATPASAEQPAEQPAKQQ